MLDRIETLLHESTNRDLYLVPEIWNKSIIDSLILAYTVTKNYKNST